MASLWKHPKSPFWSACFSVHSTPAYAERWKRSLKTKDRKLARQIADTLDEAGRGVLSERAITAFVERIGDGKARRAAEQIFRDVFRSVSGRGTRHGPLSAFSGKLPFNVNNSNRSQVHWLHGKHLTPGMRR
jgi:hypothetical protein